MANVLLFEPLLVNLDTMKLTHHACCMLGLFVLVMRAGASSLQDKVVVIVGAGILLNLLERLIVFAS